MLVRAREGAEESSEGSHDERLEVLRGAEVLLHHGRPGVLLGLGGEVGVTHYGRRGRSGGSGRREEGHGIISATDARQAWVRGRGRGRRQAPVLAPRQTRSEPPKPDPKSSVPCSSQKRCEHVVTQHAVRILAPHPGICRGERKGPVDTPCERRGDRTYVPHVVYTCSPTRKKARRGSEGSKAGMQDARLRCIRGSRSAMAGPRAAG